MADRVHIPNSPACGQWETLLSDALDGLLKPEDEATFSQHMAGCAACAALFEEARRGREWLEFLSPEPEVPEGLLDKILASTGPGQAAGHSLVTTSGEALPVLPAWQQPGLVARVRRFAEPRLMMTAAMAFFSIALTLNLTGVRLTGLKLSDLRPSSIRSFMERRLTLASTPIIRYYDHLRLVYEVQSRVRELRRNSEGENAAPQEQPQTQPATPGESKQTPSRKDGGSRVDPPQQSGVPASRDTYDYLETSLTLPDWPALSERNQGRPAVVSLVQRGSFSMKDPLNRTNLSHGSPDFAEGGSAVARSERSTVWTA
jgi:hypothetical protein